MTGSPGMASQRKATNEIVSAIVGKEDLKQLFLITGASGTGKTFVANRITNYLAEIASNYTVVGLSGDIGHCHRAYFPFTQAARDVIYTFDKTNAREGSAELSKGIPFAGDFVAYLIETIGGSRDVKKRQSIRYLTQIEQLILFDLEKMIGKKKGILIIDNLHWWDIESLHLLDYILSSGIEDQFNCFKDLKVICLHTSDQKEVSKEELKQVIEKNNFHVFQLYPISEHEFLPAFKTFGCSLNIDDVTARLLYTITNGHLLLVKKMAEYLTENMGQADNMIRQLGGDEKNQKFVEDILSVRLRDFGAEESGILAILEYAAIIGIRFSYDELLCLSKEEENILRRTVDKAKETRLIEGDSTWRSFAHDLIRNFFLERLRDRRPQYSLKFSECLSVLRPSDYLTRAKYLSDAGHLYESQVLQIIATLKDIREGKNRGTQNELMRARLSPYPDLLLFHGSIIEAYQLFHDSDFKNATKLLKGIEDVYPLKLLAEKYYLEALCLSRSMESHAIRQAVACLENLDQLRMEESEIWVRIMSTKLIMHAHLYDFENARNQEKKVMFHLAERVKFDHSANDNINIMRRKSGSLHITETAVERTGKSVEYFSAADSLGYKSNPVQYYMACNNHAGNLLCAGEFKQSFDAAKNAIDTIATYPSLEFPKPFFAANNYILSGLLSGVFKADEAGKMLGNLLQDVGEHGDQWLLRTNHAVLYALGNDLLGADKLCSEIKKGIEECIDLDHYYQFYLLVNWMGIKYLLNDRTGAIDLWIAAKEKIPKIPEAEYLIRRHNLLEEIILSADSISAEQWMPHLITKFPHQVGKSWRFFGLGYLFSDLQFWSES